MPSPSTTRCDRTNHDSLRPRAHAFLSSSACSSGSPVSVAPRRPSCCRCSARTSHVGIGIGAWAISLYALMLAVATAVYGRISDLVGQRLPLAVGVGLMSVGALVGALAPNFGVLLGARIVQGAGAAAVPTLGVAIVTARFSGPAKGVALGRVAGTAAAVSCLGPLAGGTIEGLLGWRAVIALPMLGALMLPLLWRWVPTSGSGARLDLFGAGLVAATAAGVVLLVQSPSTGPARGRGRERGWRCSAPPPWPPGYAAGPTGSCRSR